MLKRMGLYWNTLRYLKPEQIYRRIWFSFIKPMPQTSDAPSMRTVQGEFKTAIIKKPGLNNAYEFEALNVKVDIQSPAIWNDATQSQLWLYHLHYFDDLSSGQDGQNDDFYKDLILRWIDENPPGQGIGWDPYPVSKRIVNWIFWLLRTKNSDIKIKHSLAIQARWLAKRLEYHLLGNHLFENAKALVICGLFFEGPEADKWLRLGSRILDVELQEQVLSDGGHFERSPMYHNIFVNGLLDLVNVFTAYDRQDLPLNKKIVGIVPQMMHWSKVMSHPDGDISFFNDSTFGVAPSIAELEAYALRLDIHSSKRSLNGITYLNSSGFVRMQKDKAVVLADIGSVGPRYLPGHAHAGTLSFELSLDSQRIVVNSGISTYDVSNSRLEQRSTKAHNTVVIDGKNSSEVWSSFRVARRASTYDIDKFEGEDELKFMCSHNGYARRYGGSTHKRMWLLRDTTLDIEDEISGDFNSAGAYFHFEPSIMLQQKTLDQTSSCFDCQAHSIEFTVGSPKASLKDSKYSPEFGLSINNQVVSFGI
jgi:uncharacterized heparinase superfamily protein